MSVLRRFAFLHMTDSVFTALRGLAAAAATVVLLVLFAAPSRAVLLELNDPVQGFDSIVYDSTTGLEWLKLSKSVNRSYNDVIGRDGTNELAAGGDFAGFRHATALEVSALKDSAYGMHVGCCALPPDPMAALQDLIGVTVQTTITNPNIPQFNTVVVQSEGYTDLQINIGTQFGSILTHFTDPNGTGADLSHSASFSTASFSQPTASPQVGHWLVRQGVAASTPAAALPGLDPTTLPTGRTGGALETCVATPGCTAVAVFVSPVTGVGTTTPVFIDPFFSVGYDYSIEELGISFDTILVPAQLGLNDGDVLEIVVGVSTMSLIVGSPFDMDANGFSDVSDFTLQGIDPGLQIDPAAGFVAGFTFNGVDPNGQQVTVTQTPITVFVDDNTGGGPGTPDIPEPATVLLFTVGLLGLGVVRRRRACPVS